MARSPCPIDLACILAALVCLGVGGCAGVRPEPELHWLGDPERTVPERVEAVRAFAEPSHPAWAQIREQLKDLVFRLSLAQDLRIAAIEALAQDEAGEANLLAVLERTLPLESSYGNWRVIDRVGELAAARGWDALVPALVVSWARASPRIEDEERAERAAIVRIRPELAPIESVFRAATARASDDREQRERDAAFALLGRLDPDGTRTAALLAASGDAEMTPLFARMREAAVVLSGPPRTAEQLAWFRTLHEEHGETLSRALNEARRFAQRTGSEVELRHLPALLYSADHASRRLRMNREELLISLESRLAGRMMHFRTRGALAAGRKETLGDWANTISAADLLAAHAALDAVDHAPNHEYLVRQAQADLRDTTTESGGLVRTGETGELLFVEYPPRADERVGDDRFVASPEMIRDQGLALFHYHMQAQRHDNAANAGPSQGDLDYANRHGRNCIVLTFVSPTTIDADYYQPDGVRLGLGEITAAPRPIR